MKNTNQHLTDIRNKHCPDWKPVWDGYKHFYRVCYDHVTREFYIHRDNFSEALGVIYFPSVDIAQLALEHIESLYSERLSTL